MSDELTDGQTHDWPHRERRRHDGGNAEMRWENMRGAGHHTPADQFFTHAHTTVPRLDARTWALWLHGDGLREGPVALTYEDLLALPAEDLTAFIECAGNGRSYYTTQQNQNVDGTPWGMGAIGVARWRGVRLARVLERAGITADAVDLLPRGLDPEVVRDGVNLGRVRRPLPVAKAMKDVLLAYEMNGEPLTPEHGYPMRLVVPDWIGIASIKWLGDIEVSRSVLDSPWNTDLYRLFGLGHPAEGSAPLTTVSVKSVFELPPDPRFTVGCDHLLTGRAWSGNGAIRRVEVSADGGATWREARITSSRRPHTWAQWELTWRPGARGPVELMARATDEAGVTQSRGAPYNRLGYQFGAIIRHAVTVV